MDRKLEEEKLTKLINECGKRPEVFNKVANLIYGEFGELGSVINLLATWVVLQYEKEVSYGNFRQDRDRY